MSDGARAPGSSPTEQPRGAAACVPDAPNLSLVVGRALGTVVVTVDGDLDLEGCGLLTRLLHDLIDGQGNLAVAVDLGRAEAEADAAPVLVDAARRARLHGTRFIVKEPPAATEQALEASGHGDLVEVLSRRAGGPF
jgi:anti-anti-sigma regulatory factor